jgi:hypothetical protein
LVNSAIVKNKIYKNKFFVEFVSKYLIKKIKDENINIASKVSFLAGIHTAQDVNIG